MNRLHRGSPDASRINIAREQRTLQMQQKEINKDKEIIKAGRLNQQERQNEISVETKKLRKLSALPREDNKRNAMDEEREMRLRRN